MSDTNIRKERWIQHYKSSQKILLVGEGDFSFAACLAKAFRSAHNMVATSLDSLDVLLKKYGSVYAHLMELENRSCLVLHEVDVHDMNKHPTLKNMAFHVIVFNFPHSGHASWLCETDDVLIERHKKLMRGFFQSARDILREGGEIHVAHRDDGPYRRWDLEKLAQESGLALKEKVPFAKENYPGYHQKRGSFIQGNKPFPFDFYAFTFKFRIDLSHNATPSIPVVGPNESCNEEVDRNIAVVGDGDQSLNGNGEVVGSVVGDDGQKLDDNGEKVGVVLVGGDSDRISLDGNGETVGVVAGDNSRSLDDNPRARGNLSIFRGCMRCVFGLMASYSFFSVLGIW